MSRNIFQYALLGGIQGGAQGLAQGMAEERRFNQERQLMAEREAERRRYLEEQQEFRRELGVGGSRSTGARSGGAADAPFDPVEADRRVAYLIGRQPEDLAAYERGDDLVRRTKVLTEDGSNPVIGEERPENFDSLVARRREELKALRGGAVYGKDFKDVSAGMATVEDMGRLDRIERGDQGAVVAKLADKGKGEYENAGEGSIFSTVRGGSRSTEVGKSQIRENDAQASESRADASKKLRDAEDALTTGSAEKLYQQISSIRPITENMMLPKEQREQAARVLSMLMSEVERSRGGSAAPAQPKPQRGGASAPADRRSQFQVIR